MKIRYFILLILFFAFGCNSITRTTQPTEVEYKFYSSALDSLFGSQESIVLRDSIVIPFDENEIGGPTLTANAKDLIAKYSVNKNKLYVKPNISTLSYPRLVEIMKRDNGSMWDNFYTEFPSSAGWVVLSTVSYNQDSTQANFLLGHGCERYCGGEYEIIFENKNGEWEMAHLVQVAVP